MKTLNKITSKSENNTRKHWFLSTLVLQIFYPIILFSFFEILSAHNAIPKTNHLGLLGSAIMRVIPLLTLWHCTYKKHGTKLLSFYMVSSALLAIFSIGEDFIDNESFNAWATALTLIDLSIFSWWFLLSLKMKEINKNIRERMSSKNPKKSNLGLQIHEK